VLEYKKLSNNLYTGRGGNMVAVNKVKTDIFVPIADQLITNMIVQYLNTATHIKKSTLGVYQRHIESHITPYFEDMCCHQLNKGILQGFITNKLAGLSPTTIRSIFYLIKNALKGQVSLDVFVVEFPNDSNADEIESFSINEQKSLELSAKASDNINYVGITLCLYTGIRIGELCGLLWKDVDFENQSIHIRRTIQRIKSAKSDSKTEITSLEYHGDTPERIIPLPQFILSLLEEHQSNSVNDYIISGSDKPIEPRNMQYRFKRLLKNANVSPRGFNATRHTFAIRALENGFDIKTLSEILGHASPLVTLARYSHVLSESKRSSMESLVPLHW